MSSQDFEQFYESCFGVSFGVIRNGVDEKAIMNLQGDERKEAELLLLQSLGTSKDTHSRPVIALGLLGSKEAVEPLKRRLLNSVGTDRVQTALALFRIEGFPEAERIITESLRVSDTNKPDESTRWLAAVTLPYLGRTDQVVQALLEVMAEDNLIGYSATASLRTLFIVDDEVRNLLGKIMLVSNDVQEPNFVSRSKLVSQAVELINTRLM